MDNVDKVLGQIQIADEVIESIASITAISIDGVKSMASKLTEDLMGLIGKKNISKGVKVEILDEEATLDVFINLEYGYEIPEVSEKVQKKVKSEVETMTGLNVVAVNVHIVDVIVNK